MQPRFGPTIAALALGLYARHELARRMGRNSAFEHAGNVAIATAAGAVGWAFSQRAVFLLVPFFATFAILSVLTIPAGAIHHECARGADDSAKGNECGTHVSGWTVLLGCRPLLIYGLCTVLFHLANAPLLPLVGQKLALSHKDLATAMMSACIIAAQLIMLPSPSSSAARRIGSDESRSCWSGSACCRSAPCFTPCRIKPGG